MLPPLGAGSYTLQTWGENRPVEVREFELVVGQQTNLEIDFNNLQPGVGRYVQMDSPGQTLNGLLTFTTFDGSGRELVSWRSVWRSSWGSVSCVFRPEAVRLVVISEDGLQAEARLGSEDIRLVLR